MMPTSKGVFLSNWIKSYAAFTSLQNPVKQQLIKLVKIFLRILGQHDFGS